jgi:hypothetical protein
MILAYFLKREIFFVFNSDRFVTELELEGARTDFLEMSVEHTF